MIILAVEGNIGSGKSSLLRRIDPHLPPGVKILMEPVHMFQHFNNHNPLKLFYQEPKKYAFFTQSHIIDAQQEHYNKQVQEQQPIKILLSERSLFAPIIFTNTLFKMGWLSQIEREKLLGYSQKTIRTSLEDKPMGADYIFYIDERPYVCKGRIHQRGREGEEVITHSYLTCLEKEYLDYCDAFVKNHGNLSLRKVPATMPRSQKLEALSAFIVDILRQEQNV